MSWFTSITKLGTCWTSIHFGLELVPLIYFTYFFYCSWGRIWCIITMISLSHFTSKLYITSNNKTIRPILIINCFVDLPNKVEIGIIKKKPLIYCICLCIIHTFIPWEGILWRDMHILHSSMTPSYVFFKSFGLVEMISIIDWTLYIFRLFFI